MKIMTHNVTWQLFVNKAGIKTEIMTISDFDESVI